MPTPFPKSAMFAVMPSDLCRTPLSERAGLVASIGDRKRAIQNRAPGIGGF
jgi:hypothetical protein